MTGPQLCGPRVPDIHALEVVSRNPAALPGDRSSPLTAFIFVPSSLCLSPVPFPPLCSRVYGATPQPQPVGTVGFQGFFSETFPWLLATPSQASGAHGEHVSRHSEGNTAEAHHRRPQKTPGPRVQGRCLFRLGNFPSLVQCDH